MRHRRLGSAGFLARRRTFLGAQLILGWDNHAVLIVAVGDGIEMGETMPRALSAAARALVIHVQQIAW